MNAPTRFKWSVIAFLVVGMLCRRRPVTEKTIAVAPLEEIAGEKRGGIRMTPIVVYGKIAVVNGWVTVKGSIVAPYAINRDRHKCG